jgi:FkbM family methyltransferase
MRSYLVERGVDDLYRYVYALAQKTDLPLAQRSESYGQEGEDLIIGRLFDGRQTGFFVDVGAHHPFRFSNTWLLYKRGWRGINIDAMPGAMSAFRAWRPQDINIECLVSSDARPRTFFQYEEPALNTLSEDLVRQRERDAPHYRLTGSTILPARRLADILADHLAPGQAIDLLNVDVEGHDLDVLMSNDWDRFRPRVIVVELIGTAHADMEKSELYRFLEARGYRLQSKLVNSAIFAQGL